MMSELSISVVMADPSCGHHPYVYILVELIFLQGYYHIAIPAIDLAILRRNIAC